MNGSSHFPPCSGPRGGRGFSLLELMAAVAIVGILLAAGMPSFTQAIQTQRVRAAISDLHLSLLLTRSEAVKRSQNVDMQRSGASWLDGWTVVSGATVLSTVDPLEGVALTCSTDTDTAAEPCPASVTFGRSGRPDSYIEFRTYNADNSAVAARCVSMSLSGRPRVVVDEDGDVTDGCDE